MVFGRFRQIKKLALVDQQTHSVGSVLGAIEGDELDDLVPSRYFVALHFDALDDRCRLHLFRIFPFGSLRFQNPNVKNEQHPKSNMNMLSSSHPPSSSSRLLSILHPPANELAAVLRDLDGLYLTENSQILKPKTKTYSKAKKAAATAGNGTGFGGNPNDNTKALQDNKDRASKVEMAHDEKLVGCFEKLRKNLPGAVKTSSILNKLTDSKGLCSSFLELLRNDSLLDIGSRMKVYRSMLNVLLLLAKHPTTAEFLSQPLYQDPDDSSNNSPTCKQLLSSLGSQAKVFLQLQGRPTTTPKKRKVDEVEILEMDESIMMATIITDTVRAVDSFIDLTAESLDSQTPVRMELSGSSSSSGGVVDLTSDDGDCIMWISSTGSGSSSKSNADIVQSASKKAKTEAESVTLESEEAEYTKKMVPFRFEVIELCAMIAAGKTTHSFSTQTNSSAGTVSSNPKQRMTRIAKEMATLSTNLPVEFGSSVFVRVDESRMDLIKALIVGPQGTPYANGCFEFDIYLPGDYPNKPPFVLLRTTGKGSVRFNPNLYNCGKVCLSLLGTWAGEKWNPEVSSLSQVINSILFLIFVEQPYFNEPGYQSSQGTPNGDRQSDLYNQVKYTADVCWCSYLCEGGWCVPI